MNKLLSILFSLFICLIPLCSCSSDDEPASIEGSWIVTKWHNGSGMTEPDRVVRWRFANDKAYCGGETMSYTFDGKKLHVGSNTYNVKFIDT